MIVQRLLFITITLTGIVGSSNVRYLTAELDSTVSLRCEIDQLPSNAVITWVFKPKNLITDGIKWLPLYANARRLTQNNQRFIVDYTGYNIQTKTHLSILTINHVNQTDTGIYMCKSNQHHSVANLFNLTITPSMKIYPNDGIIELPYHQRSLNISCSIRELPSNNIDPLELKWFHNNQEIKHQTISHLINKYSHHNQATLTLHIKHLSMNDSGHFKCVYRNSLIISKDVQIIFTSVLGYSKSTSSRLNIYSWSSFISFLIVIFIRQ